jgi:hypothetical protein
MPAGRKLPAVTKIRNYPQPVKHLKPMALGQAGVLADLAEAAAECLLGALGVTGHGVGCRPSCRLVVPVRYGELPHRFESRCAQLDVAGISGGGEAGAGPVARVVVKYHEAAIEEPEIGLTQPLPTAVRP